LYVGAVPSMQALESPPAPNVSDPVARDIDRAVHSDRRRRDDHERPHAACAQRGGRVDLNVNVIVVGWCP